MKGVAGGANVDVEVSLRDIDADEAGVFHDPSCECGLWRPKRPFGFDDGTVGGAPSSIPVFEDPGGHGLPPTFTRLRLALGLP
jgi:hypothetical protein